MLWLSGDILFKMEKQNRDASWTSDKSPAKFSNPALKETMCFNKTIANIASAKLCIYLQLCS